MTTPKKMMMNPGMKKDQPQASPSPSQSAQKDGIMVPRMFPTEVWEFHTPIIRPRLKEQGERERKKGSKLENTGKYTKEYEKM